MLPLREKTKQPNCNSEHSVRLSGYQQLEGQMCSGCCASEGCLLMAVVRFLGQKGYKIPNYKGCLFFDSTLSTSRKHKSLHIGNTAKSLGRLIGRERESC